LLTGTPTAAGVFTFDVQVSGGGGGFATRSLTKVCELCVASPAGLVHFWAADNTAADSVGTEHGVLTGTATYMPGQIGSAFSFDGSNNAQVLTSATPLSLPADTFSIEFWAAPTQYRGWSSETDYGNDGTYTGEGTQLYAIAPENRGWSDAGVGVSVGIDSVAVFEHGDYGSYFPSLLVVDFSQVAPFGNISGWHHFVLVYENKQPRIYMDGVLLRTSRFTSPRAHVYPSKTFGNVGNYGPYRGGLDAIGIYDRVLTDAEILMLATTSQKRCIR
jgi:hypothetical protein